MSSDDSILPFISTCLAGDKKSWDYLRLRSLNQLRSQYASLAQDHEDIAQEIAIKLMSGLRQFRGATKYEFEEYLGTTIHNTAESYRCRPFRQSVAAEMNTKESRRISRPSTSSASPTWRWRRKIRRRRCVINKGRPCTSRTLALGNMRRVWLKTNPDPAGALSTIPAGHRSSGSAILYPSP